MGFFHPDNIIFRALARLVDLVGLSLLWAVCSIPLVTLVPATAALYHALYRVFRKKDEDRSFRLFFRSLRENLRQGVPASLICLGAAWALYILYQWMYYFALLDSDGVVLFVCLSVLLVQIGVPVEAAGLMMGIDSIVGMFRTASNTTGDVAISLVVARLENLVDLEVYNGKRGD